MSMIESLAAGLDGLAQMQALIAGGRRPGIGDALDFTLVEVAEGRAVFEGTPGTHAYNPMGIVHGGYFATLLDSACGCAVHTKLNAQQAYTTLELKVAFHKPMNAQTGVVRAEGKVLTFGRRVAYSEAKLIDASGRLLASATSTLLVMEK